MDPKESRVAGLVCGIGPMAAAGIDDGVLRAVGLQACGGTIVVGTTVAVLHGWVLARCGTKETPEAWRWAAGGHIVLVQVIEVTAEGELSLAGPGRARGGWARSDARTALRGSRYAGGSHVASAQQSPTGLEDGRVEIQTDGTMALAASVQGDVAPTGVLINQELRALGESRAEKDMC
ncbi:hypothetical protein NDU88_001580 [Pleurodeles waltl]|uniref:Uncharacterized protein n=1 Tax=Pleurodeles waltl TaxID=8319 RepID=A0AAV7UTR2_PLEWA|nr:hypothetical protein NDU88_001580 [Pleurodeles waltl]